MSPSRKKLAKARTHPSKRSSESNDSPRRHQRSQSDVPQTPHSQENRWKRKSRDSRGRSNSVLSPKRRPLRELSPSERNGRSPSPERCEQPISPLTVTEMEEAAQSAKQREQESSFMERPDRGTPSGTYFKSPFPTHPSQVLLPSPITPSFFITYDDGPADDDTEEDDSPAEDSPAEDDPAEDDPAEDDSPAEEEEEDEEEIYQPHELSAGTSDAPEFFKELAVEPISAGSKRNSIDSTASSIEDEDELPYPISNPRPSSDLYGSVNSRSSMMQSTIRSIPPSEADPSATSVRSSASSETFSTRHHDDRKSTGSNWTVHAPMTASTRPTSTNPRTPSPFGLCATPTPLYGPRSPGVSKDKRPVSTFGNPLSPYLEDDAVMRPVSASDAYSGKVSNFGSRDELLADLTPPTIFTPSRNSTATKAYQATSDPDEHYQEVRSLSRSVSGMSSATADESEPRALRMPKRVARPNERQNWTAQLSSTSAQAEPIHHLPPIPSAPHSPPPTEFSSRDTASASLVSLPTMQIEGSSPSSRPDSQDRGEESSAAAAARPRLRNPWQSMDSSAFFNIMCGRDSETGEDSAANSRPATKASRSSSVGTVLYVAKGLPRWARSFYSNGDTSVIGSSRPSTRSKPSQSSLRRANTHSSGSGDRRNNRHESRTASSSRPTNTAPTESPASSQFSIASIQRPRNRPHSTIISENWTPSPNLPAQATDDEYEDSYNPPYSSSSSSDDAANDSDSNFDMYSAGIEPHAPSTANTNTTGTGGPASRHQHHHHNPYQPQLRNISDVPTAADDSPHGTQRRFPSRVWQHFSGQLRYFGPAGTQSHETPRLHREQSYAASNKSFRYLRPSSWICGDSSNIDNPNRPAADRQMWLFCLGFLLPFAWMLAALLPVPEKKKRGFGERFYSRHGEEDDDGGSREGGEQQIRVEKRRQRREQQRNQSRAVEAEDGTGGVVDVEAQMEAAQLGALAERERVRAIWWRRLNRRMSVVGVAIVVVVVVVVAVTMTV
ncbi:serine-rich protein [Lasiodiplodia theobromae]|nr:serine-rich protein [Lasiodiplodia theobromae]